MRGRSEFGAGKGKEIERWRVIVYFKYAKSDPWEKKSRAKKLLSLRYDPRKNIKTVNKIRIRAIQAHANSSHLPFSLANLQLRLHHASDCLS